MTKIITTIKSHQASHTLSKTKWAQIALFLIISFISSVLSTNASAGQTSKAYSESSIKAALVYNILHFIEWQSDTLNVCVYAQDEEDISSFKSLPSQTKSGNTLDVKFLASNDYSIDQHNCHIIFISRDTDKDVYEILSQTKDTQRLTIGETSRFIPQGGMINFVRRDVTIKFEVNISALKEAGLEISSQVLRIADRVYSGGSYE